MAGGKIVAQIHKCGLEKDDDVAVNDIWECSECNTTWIILELAFNGPESYRWRKELDFEKLKRLKSLRTTEPKLNFRERRKQAKYKEGDVNP